MRTSPLRQNALAIAFLSVSLLTTMCLADTGDTLVADVQIEGSYSGIVEQKETVGLFLKARPGASIIARGCANRDGIGRLIAGLIGTD